ncbi:MAG: DUF3419 family protein [Bacilli bacterium]|nr:DUF3419 family protein [Bacilli bacterium]
MISKERSVEILNDLNEAIKLYQIIKNDEAPGNAEYCDYHPFYENTNEHLAHLLKPLAIPSDSKILTILASGDQPFNFINKGITSIDTFDINKLTEYYALGFKRTAILTLTYEQYLKLFSYFSDDETRRMEDFIISSMPEDYKYFWTEYKYALKELGYKGSVFGISIRDIKDEENYLRNNYLLNAKVYKEFQQKLLNAKINFTHANVTELPTKFSQYNLVYLSNVMDYYKTVLYADIPPQEALLKAVELTKEIYAKNVLNPGELMFSFFGTGYANEVFIDPTVEGQKHMYYAPYTYPSHRGLKKGKGLW